MIFKDVYISYINIRYIYIYMYMVIYLTFQIQYIYIYIHNNPVSKFLILTSPETYSLILAKQV